MFVFQAVPWCLIVAMCVSVIVSVIALGAILDDIKQWFKG